MSEAKHTSVGVINMFVDTCIWLDLAKQSDGGKMTAVLKKLHGQGKIELIVPKVIVDEFGRNRARVQASMTHSIRSKFLDVRKAIDEHGRGRGKQAALDELDNITHQAPIVNELATQTFDAILNLLQSGKTISLSTKIQERAMERGLKKQAPFHRNKNSVADALLIEMYGDALKAATDGDQYCFITLNVKDFSVSDSDTRNPHTDLAEFFTPLNSRYFTNLQTALISYLPHEMEELSFEFDFDEEPRALSEVLPYMNKLHDQIWYNRHKNLEYRIESGEHKLVDRWQRKNNQSTTVRSVWKGAQEAARKMEEKYGLDELGPWDDFDWGMLNGKMSAIRWMLGEDWESTLDT
jgi:hypothetical protein